MNEAQFANFQQRWSAFQREVRHWRKEQQELREEVRELKSLVFQLASRPMTEASDEQLERIGKALAPPTVNFQAPAMPDVNVTVQVERVEAGPVQAGDVRAGDVQAGAVQAGDVQAGDVQVSRQLIDFQPEVNAKVQLPERKPRKLLIKTKKTGHLGQATELEGTVE